MLSIVQQKSARFFEPIFFEKRLEEIFGCEKNRPMETGKLEESQLKISGIISSYETHLTTLSQQTDVFKRIVLCSSEKKFLYYTQAFKVSLNLLGGIQLRLESLA